ARLGEQGVWAAWAHGVGDGTFKVSRLARRTEVLATLLQTAGIGLALDRAGDVLRMRRLDLDVVPFPSGGERQFEVTVNLDEVREQVREQPGPDVGRTILILDHPVEGVWLPHTADVKAHVRWIPVP